MKDVLETIFGFIYTLSMGDYFFFIGTFLLIVLFIYVLYLIKCSDVEEKKDSSDQFDIEKVCENIEKEYKPETIKLTSYEEEQENTAIISYDELVSAKNKSNINYDDEFTYELPTLKVKKFDLNASDTFIEEGKLDIKLMSYEKEEEFLSTLKKLQKDLSN